MAVSYPMNVNRKVRHFTVGSIRMLARARANSELWRDDVTGIGWLQFGDAVYEVCSIVGGTRLACCTAALSLPEEIARRTSSRNQVS